MVTGSERLEWSLAAAYQSLAEAAYELRSAELTEGERDSAFGQLVDIRDALDDLWDDLAVL